MAKYTLEDGTEIEAFTKEEMEQEVSGLKSKVNELLTETKAEKEKRQELEKAREKEEEERQREKGEFKTLYEKTQEELQAEREAGRKFRQTVQERDREAAAFKLAAQLTKDTQRAELLKKEAMQFATFTEDGVVFEIGGVKVDPDKVTEKLSTDYPFLIDGNQSSGGGANGGSGGAGKKFSELSEKERVEIYQRSPDEYRRLRDAAKE